MVACLADPGLNTKVRNQLPELAVRAAILNLLDCLVNKVSLTVELNLNYLRKVCILLLSV